MKNDHGNTQDAAKQKTVNILLGHAFPVPVVIGGTIERGGWDLANYWAEQGVDIAIYSRQWPEFAEQETLPNGLKIFRIKGYSWGSNRWINLFNSFRYSITLIRKVRGADVQFSETVFFSFLASLFRKPGGKIFVGIHREPKKHTGFYVAIMGIFPRKRIRFVAASDFIRREVLRKCPALKGRISISLEPVDISLFVPSEERWPVPTVLFAGRIVQEKGLTELTGAFAAVLTNIPKAKLRIVGPLSSTQGSDGKYLNELRAKVRDAGLTENVEFTGFKTGKDLLDEFQKAWVFCYPSFNGEAFPNSTIEAMACATPLITTNWGPFPEQFTDGVEGFQTPSHDSVALCEKMDAPLTNDDLRSKMGKAARDRACQFSLDNVAKRYETIFNETK